MSDISGRHGRVVEVFFNPRGADGAVRGLSPGDLARGSWPIVTIEALDDLCPPYSLLPTLVAVSRLPGLLLSRVVASA